MNINKLTFKRFFITAALVIASAVAGGIAQAQTVDIFFQGTSNGEILQASGYGEWGSNGVTGMLVNITNVRYGAVSTSLVASSFLSGNLVGPGNSNDIGQNSSGQYVYLAFTYDQGYFQALVHANYLSGDHVYINGFDNTTPTDAFYTLTGVPGAPEIDGSLAPKVGFLLGCLFLMFGRKKHDSERMLTA